VWHLFLILNGSNYYNSRIDPEYPYLFNGMNCAMGEFHRIGHTDHPGTPFQMLTGFFILMVHFFLGQGDLASDVISRPEFYLMGCSWLLTILASFLTLWVVFKIYSATQSVKISLLIGSSLLLYEIALDMSYRYIPDYLLLIIVMLLAVPLIKYLFDANYSSVKFSLFTGVLIGTGVIVKVNFLPLFVVPFLLLEKVRNKVLFSVVFLITAFLNFLPIINKHAEVRKFLLGITKHDGLYGSGNQQFVNFQRMAQNLKIFSAENFWFLIVFGVIFIILVISLIKKRFVIYDNRVIRFFIGFLLASVFGLILTLKHYKAYYFSPFLALSIIVVAVLWLELLKKDWHKWVVNSLFILFISMHVFFLTQQKHQNIVYFKEASQNRNSTNDLISKYFEQSGFIIIEPSWFHSLTIDCGLAYGLSYVALQHEYYNEFFAKYPNTLTWEGKDKPLRFLRMTPYFDNELFYSGKKIELIHGPMNYATGDILSHLATGSIVRNIEYAIDTVFFDKNSQNYIIEYTNKSSWHRKNFIQCGFENTYNMSMLTDDGLTELSNQKFHQVMEHKSTGKYSLLLSGDYIKSPGIEIGSLKTNDYLKVTFKIKGNLPNGIRRIVEWNGAPIKEQDLIVADSAISIIGNHWNLIQLGVFSQQTSKEENVLTIVNNTNVPIFIDDLKVEHFTGEYN
jgi:hypothetical protein